MTLTQIRSRITKLSDELKAIQYTAKAADRDLTSAESTRVDEILAEGKSLKQSVKEANGDAEMRKKIDEMLGPIGYGNDPTRGGKSSVWGDVFLKGLPTGTYGQKDLLPSGSVTLPSISGGIVLEAERPRRLLEVIPFGPPLSGTNSFAYLQETERTHNAAPVAPGALKPESVYSLEKVEDTASTIAHLTEPIKRQDLADVANLRAYIDDALRAGVMLELENQVINGDGTGENLTGIAETSGTQAQAWDTDIFTTTRKAVTKLESVAEIEGGIFALHPNDWETIDLLQDNEARYYLGGPIDRARRLLHGKAVVTSTVITAGTGYLADFTGSTEIREREGVRVDWSENLYDPDALGAGVGASDFQLNLIRFRAEGRWGFACKRPRGIVEIALTAP